MTQEHAKKMLPFITAYAEGKPVQYRIIDPVITSWMDSGNLGFENPRCEYRIKPEPRRLWYIQFSDGTLGGTRFESEYAARQFAQCQAYSPVTYTIVKFVEEL